MDKRNNVNINIVDTLSKSCCDCCKIYCCDFYGVYSFYHYYSWHDFYPSKYILVKYVVKNGNDNNTFRLWAEELLWEELDRDLLLEDEL